MLETNLNNVSEGNKSHIVFKTETKGDDIREKIEDNTIRMIFFPNTGIEGLCIKV